MMLKVSPVTGQAGYQGSGWRVTSGFATQEYYDLFGGWHTGHDLAKSSPGGEPIYAVSDGVIKFADFAGKDGFGNLVFIKHQDNLFTRYAHLAEIYVQRNEEVRAGQIIGLLGATGRVTGPHLHFDVMLNSNALDWPGRERMRVLKQYIDPRIWFTYPSTTIPMIEPFTAQLMRVIPPEGLNVRHTPSRNGVKNYALEFGSLVEIKPVQIEANGLAWSELVSGGWVAAKYLEPA